MKLTDEQLASLDQWAACDLGPTEGGEVAALIDEVRRLRGEVERMRPVFDAAIEWHKYDSAERYNPRIVAATDRLRSTIDTARGKE